MLIVIDVQNDFVTGSLGTLEAQAIVSNVVSKIEDEFKKGTNIIFTRDTHGYNYKHTLEGEKLPVEHCIKNTRGWEIIDKIKKTTAYKDICSNKLNNIIDKATFGSIDLPYTLIDDYPNEVEIIGLCTGICVLANAVILRAHYPNMKITVDAACCACVTPESHKIALEALKLQHIDVINE